MLLDLNGRGDEVENDDAGVKGNLGVVETSDGQRNFKSEGAAKVMLCVEADLDLDCFFFNADTSITRPICIIKT